MGHEFKRHERVANQIQRELAALIQFELKDPRIGLVTVTRVTVTSDLCHAKILISSFDSKAEKEESKVLLAVLNNAAAYLRHCLMKKIHMRIMPQLHFLVDESLAYGNRMTELVNKAMDEDVNAKITPDEGN